MEQNKKHSYIAIVALLAFIYACCLFSQKVWASGISIAEVVRLTNESRAKANLNNLAENSILDAVARDKIKDMIQKDYFAHTSPEGKDPWFWFAKNGYDYAAAGENLAINFQSSESQQQAWMASPSHKKNILNPKYTEIGVAVAEGKINGQETTVTVQVFGAPMIAGANRKMNNGEGQVLPAETFVSKSVIRQSELSQMAVSQQVATYVSIIILSLVAISAAVSFWEISHLLFCEIRARRTEANY